MIEAKIIQASKNQYTGTKIATFELEYPRFIHAEFMTHRMFSRNAQSSRAVPVAKTLEVNADYVQPLVWGKNQPGMASKEVLEGLQEAQAKAMWGVAAEHAFKCSKSLADIGLHKQYTNRVTEPYSRIKVVMTATEFDNFFWLRDDEDAAQPEIVRLARVMKAAWEIADFMPLKDAEWHMPYITRVFDATNKLHYLDSDGNELNTGEALKISASCCAQISYRKLNESKEKALEIYERLFSGPKPHLSPVEHQAMCFEPPKGFQSWKQGITHVDRDRDYWSGNFKDFIQYRQVLEQS